MLGFGCKNLPEAEMLTFSIFACGVLAALLHSAYMLCW